jgi:hypothetical protein
MRRIIGTVPVEEDGSASFKVPANTPIALQPLDVEGKSLQVMRSWLTAMPGETLSCVGCHEGPDEAVSVKPSMASHKPPAEITPWYGPARNFEFAREVQPVLDKYCVGCHDGSKENRPYLKGDKILAPWSSRMPGTDTWNGQFYQSYLDLQRFLRAPSMESGMKLHKPMEFHADNTTLFRMLHKGHHGVKLDAEAMDRLITWFDLNTPCYGRWSTMNKGAVAQEAKRAELRKKYAGVDEDHEYMPEKEQVEVEFLKPAPQSPPKAVNVSCGNWPFDAAKAKQMQGGKTKKIDLGDGTSLELVYIPAGRFVMGSADNRDEAPASAVGIDKGFWMGKFEVTNKQFRRFNPEHDSYEERRQGLAFGVRGYDVNKPDMPAVRLSWKEAVSFCEWLSKESGLEVSLPTEAQWEWACRAGVATALNYGDPDTDFGKHENLGDQTLSHFVGWPYTYDWKAARKLMIEKWEEKIAKTEASLATTEAALEKDPTDKRAKATLDKTKAQLEFLHWTKPRRSWNSLSRPGKTLMIIFRRMSALTTAVLSPSRSVHTRPMLGGCTTCTAMRPSGPAVYTNPTRTRVMTAGTRSKLRASASPAAARGMTARCTRRPVTAVSSATTRRSTTLDSV